MFRHPSDGKKFNHNFYNKYYSQNGITTDLPSNDELKSFLEQKFTDTNRNIDQIKQILESINGPINNKSILDYGCSWGYTT
ncbi:hypothetical protein ACFOWA_09000 [Pedobacter lithocola]|uniref:Uncharacterized protein n=1 Tax=Pedobacter lithocola TaxID=1908239 RepID=A0ABV8PB01_9SPHI